MAIVIASQEELDDCVRQYGMVQRSLKHNEAEMNAAIEKAKVPFVDKANELNGKLARLSAAMDTFLGANGDELLTKLKTKECIKLNYGESGYKLKEPELTDWPKKGSDQMEALAILIADLKVAAQKRFDEGNSENPEEDQALLELVIHIDRYVHKDDVKRLPAAVLAKLGLATMQPDPEFFVKPNQQLIKLVAEQAERKAAETGGQDADAA